MIFNREQIDAHATLRRAMDDDFRNGTFRTDWPSIHALINGTDDLIDTARAYHDLRDAVLAGHEPLACTDNPWDAVQERCASDDQPWPCEAAEVVARVERGTP